jgi:hypothetical protein
VRFGGRGWGAEAERLLRGEQLPHARQEVARACGGRSGWDVLLEEGEGDGDQESLRKKSCCSILDAGPPSHPHPHPDGPCRAPHPASPPLHPHLRERAPSMHPSRQCAPPRRPRPDARPRGLGMLGGVSDGVPVACGQAAGEAAHAQHGQEDREEDEHALRYQGWGGNELPRPTLSRSPSCPLHTHTPQSDHQQLCRGLPPPILTHSPPADPSPTHLTLPPQLQHMPSALACRSACASMAYSDLSLPLVRADSSPTPSTHLPWCVQTPRPPPQPI